MHELLHHCHHSQSCLHTYYNFMQTRFSGNYSDLEDSPPIFVLKVKLLAFGEKKNNKKKDKENQNAPNFVRETLLFK